MQERRSRIVRFEPNPAPAGNKNLITLFAGSAYTLPAGIKSLASCAPPNICNNTGTVGGTNVAPFTSSLKSDVLNAMLKLMFTSAPPGTGSPGAPGFSTGTRLNLSPGHVAYARKQSDAFTTRASDARVKFARVGGTWPAAGVRLVDHVKAERPSWEIDWVGLSQEEEAIEMGSDGSDNEDM
ncbi:hypothetical protein K435DRAFT_859073 [Dendrothele bispora CBS 962.96]|uniref:Uncharacterized protein n=1 Tax=Dendrothele bispora (strain CBS 962.96) TaxID=1314807 RepID=A0A4S8M1U1_DENBC|nr:hypothetical protein K435DRAFT_859073 [Dendrothele bispora CBS 962.96]